MEVLIEKAKEKEIGIQTVQTVDEYISDLQDKLENLQELLSESEEGERDEITHVVTLVWNEEGLGRIAELFGTEELYNIYNKIKDKNTEEYQKLKGDKK